MTKFVDVYEFIEKGRVEFIGTMEEVIAETGIERKQLWKYCKADYLKRNAHSNNVPKLVRVGKKEVPRQSRHDYAVYDDDEFVIVGDLFEISKKLGVSTCAVRGWQKKTSGRMAIKLDKE